MPSEVGGQSHVDMPSEVGRQSHVDMPSEVEGGRVMLICPVK